MLIFKSVPLQSLGWIEDYFQTFVVLSSRSNRSAMLDGNSGNTDVAFLTAVGNLAGWAVARVTIGISALRCLLAVSTPMAE